MLKLKLQYLDRVIWRTDSLEKTLTPGKMKVGGEGDDRGWDGGMASLTQWPWVWVGCRSWWWIREAWCAAVRGVTKSQTWLSNWTELMWQLFHHCSESASLGLHFCLLLPLLTFHHFSLFSGLCIFVTYTSCPLSRGLHLCPTTNLLLPFDYRCPKKADLIGSVYHSCSCGLLLSWATSWTADLLGK